MNRLDFGNNALQFLRQAMQGIDCVKISNKKRDSLVLEDAFNIFGNMLLNCSKENKKVLFVGNGGSAAIASHLSIDFWKNGSIRAIAFNDASLLTCLSNDYGYEYVFSKSVSQFAEGGDILITISSSGQSQNILNAVASGREKKCSIITFSGFSHKNALRDLGDLNFYVPSFNYGIVECLHLTLLHSLLDSYMKCTQNYDMKLGWNNEKN